MAETTPSKCGGHDMSCPYDGETYVEERFLDD
jgi:hypothetical protein